MTETPPRPTGAALWNERYGEAGFSFGTAPNAFLAACEGHLRAGMRALVPGDGEGRNGVWLATRGLDVVTVDAAEVGVDKARRLAADSGVTIDARVADLTAWTWPVGAFDLVASIYLHWPPALRPAMHARMIEALRPGGLFLLEAYTPRQLEHRARGSRGGPPDVAMLFEPAQLAGDFADLDILVLGEHDVDVDEGRLHQGRSAVVRLLARKQGSRS
jgi:hypothetical protein